MLRSVTVTEVATVMLIRDEDAWRGGYYSKYDGNCAHYQLVYKLSGKNRLFFDGGAYEERENTLRFLPKGRVGANYEVYTDEPGECIDICFQTDRPIEADCFVSYFGSDTRIRSLFIRLERLWRGKHTGYYHAAMALVYEILAELEKKSLPYHSSREEQLIQPAVAYLEEHFLDSIDYAGLAPLCDISSSYFRKLFHRQYGMSPIQFVNQQKIRYGCDLLATGQYNITQAAELARFDNVYYFSKVFKKVLGISPSQYLKEKQCQKV